jgi:hypothetical protein
MYAVARPDSSIRPPAQALTVAPAPASAVARQGN